MIKSIAKNKKAYHDYFIEETFEAGLVLVGTEIKSIRQGKVQSPVTVSLPGGDLVISWAPDEHILMQGPATFVFEGEIDWAHFP